MQSLNHITITKTIREIFWLTLGKLFLKTKNLIKNLKNKSAILIRVAYQISKPINQYLNRSIIYGKMAKIKLKKKIKN
jgi:hypothetical protein